MSSHNPQIDHPRAREVVVWMVWELCSATALQDLLDVADATEAEEVILKHRQRLGTSTEDGLPDRFLVARELVESGGRVQSFSGVDPVQLQVMAECHAEMPRVDEWHEDVHAAVNDALVGKKPSVTTGSAATPLRRARKPARPQWDATDQTFYSTSTFRATLRP